MGIKITIVRYLTIIIILLVEYTKKKNVQVILSEVLTLGEYTRLKFH